MRGRRLVGLGQGTEAMVQMQEGISAHLNTGAKAFQSYLLALLADAYWETKQSKEGLVAVLEALKGVDKTGECWYEAELHRLKGKLLLLQSFDNQTEAESCFQQALSIAKSQQAKSLELRAATSLARLWQHQDKRQEAYDLLAPVYGWFTEGFDTADLQEAKGLLGELEHR